MASGIEHDKAAKLGSVIFGLIVGLLTDPRTGVIAGISFAIGGLWLSPDLDTNSKPLKRWGFLKILWRPYCKLIPHRSMLSHGFLIGTSLRVIYLLITVGIFILILDSLGISLQYSYYQIVLELTRQYPKEIIAIISSLEVSAWLHLYQDHNQRKIKSMSQRNK